MGDLELQSKILKGSNDPISNRELTKNYRQVLKQVEYINHNSAMASMYDKYKTYSTAVLWKNRMFLWLHLPVFAS